MDEARVRAGGNPAVEFAEKLSASLASETFVRLVLSHSVQGPDGPGRVLGRCIHLKGEPHLSLTFRYATRDEVKNLPIAESRRWVLSRLGGEFQSALLCTTERDWQLSMPEGKEARLTPHKASTRVAPARQHDQSRHAMLDAAASDWLSGVGITDAQGKVRPAMADKYRQINRYLEILSHLGKEMGWGKATAGTDSGKELVVADMGCGKGYLTFGAWHLLRRIWNIPARVIGVEVRPELVADANRVVREIKALGLEFICGAIDVTELPPMDALIALHACDTATDQAIQRGIGAGARLILVAPCCHKEIRPQLGRPPPLAPLLHHGLMEERMAEWVTDGLRALFLQWAGYRTKIFEFVSSEHTPKNLMIAAIRDHAPFSDPAARERIVELKTFFGIKDHSLDPLLSGGATEA